MRTSPLLLPLLTCLALAGAAHAQDLKVAVVDLDQAINATEEGKSAREELSRKQRSAKEKLQPMFERAQKLKKEIDDKRFVLSPEALYQKQLDLVELRNQVETTQQEFEGQFKVDYERMVAPLRNRLLAIVEEIGKEQSFAVILERNTRGLLYAREALDITDSVIQRFNQEG